MPNELWVAGAGSGKTNKIITDAIEVIKNGGRVLVVTFTTNNQAELRARFAKLNGSSSENFVVKGLFSFYLEDLVRPYQGQIFPDRIATTFFTDSNPHFLPDTTVWIKGRGEKLANGAINPLHYLTPCKTKAYTGLLAKLATLIAKKSKGVPAKRLKGIYQKIFFDEVQDLVGWDYDVLETLNAEIADAICCVGDFRQTIYTTTFGHKAPQTPQEKIDFFVDRMKFKKYPLPKNRRCIQEICTLSDSIHPGQYEKTISDVTTIPDGMANHSGVFIVKRSQVAEYISTFQPQVLRWSSNTGNNYLPSSLSCYTFGSSKGMGFDRVLIVPTEKQMKFFCGYVKAFDKEKTDQSQNKLYVAVTRARYSLGVLIEDKLVKNLPYPVWDSDGVQVLALLPYN